MPTTREILGYIFRERSVCAQKLVWEACLVSVDPGEGEPEAVLLECLYASITATLEVVGSGKFEVATVQEDLKDRQVWSLTQFYSVDFCTVIRDWCKQVCFQQTNQLRFFVSCNWRCPATFALCVTHLTLSLIFCSPGSNKKDELWTLEGSRVSSISPSRVQDWGQGVAGRNGRQKYLPNEGS